MPRIQDGVERMTTEEINAIANQAKNEIVSERKVGRPRVLKTEGVSPMETNVASVQEVGVQVDKKASPDKAIESKFQFVPCAKKGWIAMSEEESVRFSEMGVLVGYDPAAKLGLLKKD